MTLSQHTTGMITQTANVAQYAGSGVALYFGFTINELGVIVGMIGVICGIVVGLAGFFVNLYYRRAHLKLAESRKLVGYDSDRAPL